MIRPLLLLCCALLSLARAQPAPTAAPPTTWQRPPPEVQRVLDAPDLPSLWISPTRASALLATSDPAPPLADLSRASLKLAGARIYPSNRARVGETCTRALTLKRLDTGVERAVPLPAGACVVRLRWAADGARFALANRVEAGVEVYIFDVKSFKLKQIKDLALNPMLGAELQWMPDQRQLLVKAVAPGAAPARSATPLGPIVAETSGSSASSTYEARDLLASPDDDAAFAFYASSQLALVSADTGKVNRLGAPGLLGDVSPSPDGSTILVQTLLPPFSHRVAWGQFQARLELWDNPERGASRTFATLPAAETVPIDGVPTGPRDVGWRPNEPRTLVWLEALDGGDPDRAVAHRDRLMALPLDRAALNSPATELHRATHRIVGVWWGARGQLLVRELDRDRRWSHTWLRWADLSRKLFDLSAKDHYADPGQPMMETLPTGTSVMVEEGDHIFLAGPGGSPAGDRPFVDRLNLRTGASERLFRSDPDVYESPVAWLDLASHTMLTRRESPSEVPNYQRRALAPSTAPAAPGEAAWTGPMTPVTAFPDPTPELRQIRRELVQYTRADGVPLSFTLYLPPGYQEGTRLPTVLTAYPLEFSDPSTAGQVKGSDRTSLRLRGSSPLFLLLSGYAVLYNASMPVIGPPETAYDSFVEQVVASAAAAIDQAVAMGVTDRDRVAVWGHSHGGLMVATLLAHSDLFRAGIARSGAYNHTIRPFGFQNEHRTLWEATDTYLKLSPVMFAPQINEPILIIHGAADQNPGTIPFQSARLYEAIRGVGGTARLVMLPDELHGYAAKESIEQVLAEQVRWMDRWVKGAAPRAQPEVRP